MADETTTSEVTKERRSKRLTVFLVSIGVLTIIGLAALYLKADEGLVLAVAGPIVTITLGALGGISWMDKAVRIEEIKAGTRT